jgi:small GTP-binding protein
VSTQSASAPRGLAASTGLDEFIDIARTIEQVSGTDGSLGRRAQRLAERLAAGRYHIAVLGDFKRGKSTLVNALIGHSLLPSGVVPLTTVATEVHIGDTSTSVVFRDGSRRAIPQEEIASYATEQANPANVKGVERVEVGVVTQFGAAGLVLVDTPGLSSVNEANTEEAQRALLDTDGAIVVLAADNPLSMSERDVLEHLAGRGGSVFVVINRCDVLAPDEVAEVRQFIEERMRALLGDSVQLFCVSARHALERASSGIAGDPLEFDQLRKALTTFIERDLAGARLRAAVAELERLGGSLERILGLEEAAESMELASLEEKTRVLTSAAEEGRRLLDEDIVLLGHDSESLIDGVGRELSELAASAARRSLPALAAAVAELPRGRLDRGARDAIEALVRSHFEPIRTEMADEVEASWDTLADRFTGRVQGRLDQVVATASDLFAVHLPSVEVPALEHQRARFSYHFLYVESQNAVIGHALSRLVPDDIARRQTVRRATQRLYQEFDKHAGRARYDTAERLRSARTELARAMVAEFEETQASLLAACTDARALRELGEAGRSARAVLRTRLRALVGTIQIAVGGERA